MKTKIDLSQYEKMYDTFDKGHDQRHLNEVRDFAILLAEKYAPEMKEAVYVGATLHDLGLSIQREGHEELGYNMFKDNEELKNNYSQEEIEEILDAIKEHRASSGNPKTIVGQIVSDADKVATDTKRSFQRAYDWGKENLPTVNHPGLLLRAASHLREKFGPGGTGTRLYFDESKEKQNNTYEPIFQALDKYDFEAMESFLK